MFELRTRTFSIPSISNAWKVSAFERSSALGSGESKNVCNQFRDIFIPRIDLRTASRRSASNGRRRFPTSAWQYGQGRGQTPTLDTFLNQHRSFPRLGDVSFRHRLSLSTCRGVFPGLFPPSGAYRSR